MGKNRTKPSVTSRVYIEKTLVRNLIYIHIYIISGIKTGCVRYLWIYLLEICFRFYTNDLKGLKKNNFLIALNHGEVGEERRGSLTILTLRA